MAMIELELAPDLRAAAPRMAVGVVTAAVTVRPHDEELWREIEVVVEQAARRTMDDVRAEPEIKALRDTYRTLGQDPTRYRGSSEALFRRLVQGKRLYRVNTVVDINNLISLESRLSAGTVDADRLAPPVVFRVGRQGESYAGIGRGEINLAGLPLLADNLGPFGSTTSDSERSMVRLETRRIMLLAISFRGSDTPRAATARAVGLLEKYAAANDVETALVQ